MDVATFGARPLEGGLGCRVDLDPRQPLDGTDLEALRRLFDEHYLLVLSGHSVSREHHERLISYLGPVLRSDRTATVSNVESNGILGDLELGYHSDLSFSPEPYPAISLHALDVAPGATSTRFASTVRAYANLPRALKDRIEDLENVHIYAYEPGGHDRNGPIDDSMPRTTHPVVWKHSRTGDPLLYVCDFQTDHIVGLPRDESNALLEELFSYLYDESNVYEHWWQPKDLLIWDNVALQHARSAVDSSRPRTLQRVVMAERDLLEIIPGFTLPPRAGGCAGDTK